MPDSDLTILFRDALKTNDSVVAALIDDGYPNLEAVAYVPAEELAKTLVLEEADVQLLQERAREYLLDQVLGTAKNASRRKGPEW